ncbi:uncharacterized protein LOC124666449 [Lolium rigidum]|uniref:uncharacterized protein LOC124666449 n=1 Tax=Lolium rigidum TaxID=89674 RepID=UPI001F5CD675|nr:uncharacterized protein LOC124666449 [Lolium rigidum]
METEAFPIGFTKGIRSYWRRSKYQRVDGGGGGTAGRGTRHLVRLGDGSSGDGDGKKWGVRLGGMFRVRVKAPAVAAAAVPKRVLGGIRDAYVDAMVGAAKKHSAASLSLPSGPVPEALWQKRVPVRRSLSQAQTRQKADELGQRLVLEMYKSVRASRDLSGMLQASAAR